MKLPKKLPKQPPTTSTKAKGSERSRNWKMWAAFAHRKPEGSVQDIDEDAIRFVLSIWSFLDDISSNRLWIALFALLAGSSTAPRAAGCDGHEGCDFNRFSTHKEILRLTECIREIGWQLYEQLYAVVMCQIALCAPEMKSLLDKYYEKHKGMCKMKWGNLSEVQLWGDHVFMAFFLKDFRLSSNEHFREYRFHRFSACPSIISIRWWTETQEEHLRCEASPPPRPPDTQEQKLFARLRQGIAWHSNFCGRLGGTFFASMCLCMLMWYTLIWWDLMLHNVTAFVAICTQRSTVFPYFALFFPCGFVFVPMLWPCQEDPRAWASEGSMAEHCATSTFVLKQNAFWMHQPCTNYAPTTHSTSSLAKSLGFGFYILFFSTFYMIEVISGGRTALGRQWMLSGWTWSPRSDISTQSIS